MSVPQHLISLSGNKALFSFGRVSRRSGRSRRKRESMVRAEMKKRVSAATRIQAHQRGMQDRRRSDKLVHNRNKRKANHLSALTSNIFNKVVKRLPEKSAIALSMSKKGFRNVDSKYNQVAFNLGYKAVQSKHVMKKIIWRRFRNLGVFHTDIDAFVKRDWLHGLAERMPRTNMQIVIKHGVGSIHEIGRRLNPATVLFHDILQVVSEHSKSYNKLHTKVNAEGVSFRSGVYAALVAGVYKEAYELGMDLFRREYSIKLDKFKKYVVDWDEAYVQYQLREAERNRKLLSGRSKQVRKSVSMNRISNDFYKMKHPEKYYIDLFEIEGDLRKSPSWLRA